MQKSFEDIPYGIWEENVYNISWTTISLANSLVKLATQLVHIKEN
jgi:hypothetical protein